MIYSQTRPHNGLKRVSIKADTDGAPVTFLDTQRSAVPSAAALPSYLQSLHLFFSPFFFSYLNCSPLWPSLRDAHMQVRTSPSSSATFTHQRLPTDNLSVGPTFCKSQTDVQASSHRGDGALPELASSVVTLGREAQHPLAPCELAAATKPGARPFVFFPFLKKKNLVISPFACYRLQRSVWEDSG